MNLVKCVMNVYITLVKRLVCNCSEAVSHNLSLVRAGSGAD
jgi:hypothetical protein